MENQKGDRRIQRVEREMRECLATFALTRLQGKLPAMISIPQVQVSRDLRSARVFIQVLDDAKKMDEVLERLEMNAFEMGQEINRRLHMRFCPKLRFLADRGWEASQRVENILVQIRENPTC